MGKNKHSKDRMFVTATEHKYLYGGKRERAATDYRRLPFDHCALSFAPFDTPVATPEGHVFDLVNILPHLKRNGNRNPLSGAPLAPKDLISLTFHRNAAGKYHCPVTFKELGDATHVFLASLLFDDDFMRTLASRLDRGAPRLRVIATLKRFPEGCLSRFAECREPGAAAGAQPASTERVEATWGEARVYFYRSIHEPPPSTPAGGSSVL